MISDIKKEDLRRKAQLVVGGHAIDSSHLDSCSSVTQSISTRILLAVTAKNKLNVASEDEGNAFSFADSMEKVHAIASLEFGFREEY